MLETKSRLLESGIQVPSGGLEEEPSFKNRIAVAAWADNLYTFSVSRSMAMNTMTAVGEALWLRWGLVIKDSSRELWDIEGGLNIHTPIGWKLSAVFLTLGHWFAPNCKAAQCYTSTMHHAGRLFGGPVPEVAMECNTCQAA